MKTTNKEIFTYFQRFFGEYWFVSLEISWRILSTLENFWSCRWCFRKFSRQWRFRLVLLQHAQDQNFQSCQVNNCSVKAWRPLELFKNSVTFQSYALFSDSDISYFERILPKGSVKTDSEDVKEYNTDWMKQYEGGVLYILFEIDFIHLFLSKRILYIPSSRLW